MMRSVGPGVAKPCAGKTDLFFERQHEAEAKALCGGCVVRDDCLEVALVNREPDGIWGGKDPDERRRLARQLRRAAAAT